MLNPNFTFTFHKINENFLVVFPIFIDISFRWEKTNKNDIVLEVVSQTVCQFLLIQNILDKFIVFLVILFNAIENGVNFIYSFGVYIQCISYVRVSISVFIFYLYLLWLFILIIIWFLNIGGDFVFVFLDILKNFFTSLVQSVVFTCCTTRITL